LLTCVFIRSSADEIVYIDLEHPENNGGFVVCRVTDGEASRGKELIDTIKVLLPHIADLRDSSKYQAHLVLNGKAMLIQQPTVPYYLLNEHQDLLNEQNECVRSKQAHSVQVDRILKDSSPLMKNTLLMFPPGVMCSADFTMAAIPTEGDKVKIYQRTLTATRELGKSDRASTQVFVPCYWMVRVLADNGKNFKLRDNNKRSKTH
jgi:hypothetical protein